MSFLTPLYLLAGLAVALPIFFHLIRQTPRGRQVFSSVMFLTPSPPRVTRRSRIEHWLLLLLRALAVCLLALAFARPFLRSRALADAELDEGERIVILLDTSASMRRDGYWDAARERLANVLGAVQPVDVVALLTFDREITPVLTFDDWGVTDPGSRAAAVLDRLDDVEPSWESTELGVALIQAAELVDEKTEKSQGRRRIIVISDLQAGSRWEPLNGFAWPDSVAVQFERIRLPGRETNAAVQIVANDAGSDEIIRVRVSNSDDAAGDLFHVQWQDVFADAPERGGSPTEDSARTMAYVPAGQSRVVRAPAIDSGTFEAPQSPSSVELQPDALQGRDDLPPVPVPQRLVLTGDEEPFDNVCFVADTPVWQVEILYVGQDESSNPLSGLRFFLEPVFPSVGDRVVRIHDWSDQASAPPIPLADASLIIVGGSVTGPLAQDVRDWTNNGGLTLFVARDPDQASSVYDLLEVPPHPVPEADIADYSMLSDVDLSHPVLSQFDDPRFSDFTKLRFWKYRAYDAQTLSTAQILARFEEGFPAIAELRVGKGRVFLFASGWGRDDSELAVSSKFVPLMNRILEYGSNRARVRPQFTVGDELSLAEFDWPSERATIRTPQGDEVELAIDNRFRFEVPGIYKVAEDPAQLSESDTLTLAVNISSDESRTSALSVEMLEANGVLVAVPSQPENAAEAQQLQRQLLAGELEAEQQLWKWLLAAALGVLFLETTAGAWLSRKRPIAATLTQ